MEEKDKSYLEKLNRHADSAKESADYSMGRIDLLIISVSGAGIYICLEILKYLKENDMDTPTIIFKLIGVLLTFAIILNFLSQWFSYYANTFNKKATDKVIYDTENGSDSKKEIHIIDGKVICYSKYVRVANLWSTILMLIGLLGIIACFCITF